MSEVPTADILLVEDHSAISEIRSLVKKKKKKTAAEHKAFLWVV